MAESRHNSAGALFGPAHEEPRNCHGRPKSRRNKRKRETSRHRHTHWRHTKGHHARSARHDWNPYRRKDWTSLAWGFAWRTSSTWRSECTNWRRHGTEWEHARKSAGKTAWHPKESSSESNTSAHASCPCSCGLGSSHGGCLGSFGSGDGLALGLGLASSTSALGLANRPTGWQNGHGNQTPSR